MISYYLKVSWEVSKDEVQDVVQDEIQDAVWDEVQDVVQRAWSLVPTK